MANTSNYMEQGGDKWVIGGELNFVTGATITPNSGTVPTVAALTENSGAIGGTNDGDIPSLASPDAATNAAAIREVAEKLNDVIAALQALGLASAS